MARGLTMEELDCKLFLRHATTYDALMQMGRWFKVGAKPRRPSGMDVPGNAREFQGFGDHRAGDSKRHRYMANQDPPKTPKDLLSALERIRPFRLLRGTKCSMQGFKTITIPMSTNKTYKFFNNPEWLEQNWVAGRLGGSSLAWARNFIGRDTVLLREVPVDCSKPFWRITKFTETTLIWTEKAFGLH